MGLNLSSHDLQVFKVPGIAVRLHPDVWGEGGPVAQSDYLQNGGKDKFSSYEVKTVCLAIFLLLMSIHLTIH